MAAEWTFLVAFIAGVVWAVWTLRSWWRQTRAHRAHREVQPDCPLCVQDRSDTDFRADVRYRQAVTLQAVEAHRTRRDKTLAAETERLRVVEYLALPEPERDERWLAWQLTNHPLDDPLPYPPPNYPPPAG